MKMILKGELMRQLYPDTADGNVQLSDTLFLMRKLVGKQTTYDARIIVYGHWQHFRIDGFEQKMMYADCSACNESAAKKMFHDSNTYTEQDARNNFYAYCPNCGAYMKGADYNEKND